MDNPVGDERDECAEGDIVRAVECRGRRWTMSRRRWAHTTDEFVLWTETPMPERPSIPAASIYARWNARIRAAWVPAKGPEIYTDAWTGHLAWLPVAWLCLLADDRDGPNFARAIIDAEEGDDAPALIAADWLEERGCSGHIKGELAPLALGWGYVIDGEEGGFARAVAVSGPIASWCRLLIEGVCVACGAMARDAPPRAAWVQTCYLCRRWAPSTLPRVCTPVLIP